MIRCGGGMVNATKSVVMFSNLLRLLLLSVMAVEAVVLSNGVNLINFDTGFKESEKMQLSGEAAILPSGILQLTNETTFELGQAFYRYPAHLTSSNKSADASSPRSFSTTFVLGITNTSDKYGDGMTFVLSSTNSLDGAQPGYYLGVFNSTIEDADHIVAVEFDTAFNSDINDTKEDHVGIDVGSIVSKNSSRMLFFDDELQRWKNLSLVDSDAQPFMVWIDYDGRRKMMSVTIAPSRVSRRPSVPLLTLAVDLSLTLSTDTYVGFTAATGSVASSHYVLGWSFSVDGEVATLDVDKLPKLPGRRRPRKNLSPYEKMAIVIAVVLFVGIVGAFFLARRRKFAEIREPWEEEYGPHRFSYKELYLATDGFNDGNFIGAGGFGRVYKGVLGSSSSRRRKSWSETETIAVKKMLDNSHQGLREFVSEIVSMGRLRHRNLVRLQGYCRRRGEFILVYDYMPNGSLDKHIFSDDDSTSLLNWAQRFHIIKDVAAGLLYLHEGGEQVIIHRDIKAGNVLLDDEMNGKLSDFGLARFHDRGSNPTTTSLVGTVGYIAPELIGGRATTATDVYAFGCFLLEVTCGTRPIREVNGRQRLLVDWVLGWWNRGEIMRVVDPSMRGDYTPEEVERVLILALLCAQRDQEFRPSIRQVVQVLGGEVNISDSALANMHKATPLLPTGSFATDESEISMFTDRGMLESADGSSSPSSLRVEVSCTTTEKSTLPY